VTLADEIFPSKHGRDLVQTRWAEGWSDSEAWGFSGIAFGEAATFLTENRAKFGASIDQVGLVIFYLQRHRVELAMKELLINRGVEFDEMKKAGHSLEALWNACAEAVGEQAKEWHDLDANGAELVTLMHKHDPSSDAYRYPVNRKGKKHKRPKYIDLGALETHVDNFVWMIRGYLDYVEEEKRAEQEYNEEMRQYAE
jgi:hypothetical protein